MKKLPRIFRHGYVMRRVLTVTLLCIGTAVSVFIGLNQRYGWSPEFTWRSIYQRTGLGLNPYSEAPCQVRVLDVGAGDAILIRCDAQWILVDTGLDTSRKELERALHRCGVRRLSMLIVSHDHTDHTGGLEMVLKEFRPERVLLGKDPPALPSTDDAVRWLCRKYGAMTIAAETGDCYIIGNLSVEVLSDGSAFSDENNRSLVLRMRYGMTTMLFTGDAEVRTEKQLLASGTDLCADWLKVAHHGSHSASSEEFLAAVAPGYAAISCGWNNPPDEEVIQRLRALNVCYARTDLHGELLFYTDGKNCGMMTEKD
ncbi:MAG: MBL fold metallo-hydrolase [Clostridia bacterium]|nr:MBL fold metallo-hydrolase [Clostridia bacterium]